MPRSRGRKPTSEEMTLWQEFAGPADPELSGSTFSGANAAEESDAGQAKGKIADPTGAENPNSADLADGTRGAGRSNPVLDLENIGIGTAARTDLPSTTTPRETADGWESAGSIDRKIERRLKSGRLNPERRIDLHGMDRKQAEASLRRFLHNCRDSGVRLVLVVTGKGRGSRTAWFEEEPGVLRRSVPAWLQQGPLSAIVQHYSVAHASHGGQGAFYVYLRQVRQPIGRRQA